MDCDGTEFEEEDPNKDGPGCYLVEGIDLFHDSDGGDESEGLLIWLPLDRCYGAWAGSHNVIFTFDQSTTWKDIVEAPVRYLNARCEIDDTAPLFMPEAVDQPCLQ